MIVSVKIVLRSS